MPGTKFQPASCKQEVMRALREGMSPEECATKFPITERTAFRYLREIQDEKLSGNSQPRATSTKPIKVTIEAEFQDAFALLEAVRLLARGPTQPSKPMSKSSPEEV